MNTDFLWNIDQVIDGIPRGILDERAKRSFLYPHENIWPQEKARFSVLADEIYYALHVDRKESFISVCFASFLLNPHNAPLGFAAWLQGKKSIAEILGLDLSWDALSSWTWGRAAIPGVDQVEGWNDKVIYALVGTARDVPSILQMPPWTNKFLSREASTAVQSAAELLAYRTTSRGFLFWPMIDPSNSSFCIKGGSLGLPVYLSFFSLLANTPIPAILATGALGNNGRILEVAGLEEKLRLAHKKGFTTFMYPLLEGVKALDSTDKVETRGVQTLEEAELLWNYTSISSSTSQNKELLPASLENIVKEVQGLREKLTDPLKEIDSATNELRRAFKKNRLVVGVGLTAAILVLLYVAKTGVVGTSNHNNKDNPAITSNSKRITPTLSVEPKSETQIRTTVTSDGGHTKGKDPTNATNRNAVESHPVTTSGSNVIAAEKVLDDLNIAIDNRMLREHNDNATTVSCFRVAKEMMINGQYVIARKKYEECFKVNSSYLDTHLDYQALLKGTEGYAGARTSYINIMKDYSNTTIVFASLLLEEPKSRYLKIKKFIEYNSEYAPAYYWLGMDCFDNTEAEEICANIARNFLKLAKSGKVNKYFINSRIIDNMITEAREKSSKQ